MSNNKYMDKLEAEFELQHATYDVIRTMALIKELQTLNETLKELVQVGPGGEPYIIVTLSD